MRYIFYGAAAFTGTGVDLWNINQVKDMTYIFQSAKALTSCNKRKIADAWKSSAAFTSAAFTSRGYDADWAADKCACVSGTSFSATGFSPCTMCASATTCGTSVGVKTACTTTTNMVCNVRDYPLLRPVLRAVVARHMW
jgi:hypothetical protein